MKNNRQKNRYFVFIFIEKQSPPPAIISLWVFFLFFFFLFYYDRIYLFLFTSGLAHEVDFWREKEGLRSVALENLNKTCAVELNSCLLMSWQRLPNAHFVTWLLVCCCGSYGYSDYRLKCPLIYLSFVTKWLRFSGLHFFLLMKIYLNSLFIIS